MMPISPLAIFAIALGGSVGAVLRYLIVVLVKNQLTEKTFPFATLFANVLGSFLLGIFFTVCIEKKILGENWQLFLILGLTGSLTTFSTFSLETLKLLQKENYLLAFYNLLLNMGLTIVFLLIAMFLTRLVINNF
jgi:CrcB protein